MIIIYSQEFYKNAFTPWKKKEFTEKTPFKIRWYSQVWINSRRGNVSLTRFGIIRQTLNLSVREFLDRVNWGENTLSEHGQYYCMDWRTTTAKREKVCLVPAFLFLCFLALTAIWPAASCSCRCAFPATLDCALKRWSRTSPSSFKSASVRYFVSAVRKANNKVQRKQLQLYLWLTLLCLVPGGLPPRRPDLSLLLLFLMSPGYSPSLCFPVSPVAKLPFLHISSN